jgi:methionine synthase II (cobalamin-independent)
MIRQTITAAAMTAALVTGDDYNGAQEQADAYAETLAEIWATVDGARMVQCETCAGGYGAPDDRPDVDDETADETCPDCDGTGEILATDYEGSDRRPACRWVEPE